MFLASVAILTWQKRVQGTSQKETVFFAGLASLETNLTMPTMHIINSVPKYVVAFMYLHSS